jgi:ketosteroid isomerase-like protein
MAVILGCTLPLIAQEESEARTQSQIIALERMWNLAYKTGDVKALGSLFDDSLVLIEDNGSLKSKAQFLAGINGPTSNEEQVSPESLTVRVFGKTAIAIGVIAVKAKENGKTVTRRERFIDTWISKNGSWICIATDATPMLH